MKVLFPGSFDPMHEGHLKIIKRASRIFDDVLVLVAQNPHKKYTDIIDRCEFAKKSVKRLKLDNVKVDFWSGQIMEYFEKYYFDVVIRSIRDGDDLEWEEKIAAEYKKQNVDVEFLYFISDDVTKSIKSSMKIKQKKNPQSLFAFDVDGTILNDKKKLLPSIKNSFKKLIKNGHKIIIVTGRTPCQIFDLCEELEFDGFILGTGGASIYNFKKRKYFLSKKFIPKSDIELMIQKAYKIKRELTWSNGKEINRVYFGENPKKDIKDPLFFLGGTLNPIYQDWEECKHTLNDGIVQISIKSESWISSEVKKDLERKISKHSHGVETCSVYYELGATGVDKYTAIKTIQELYGIDNENTYAFGDSENDISMLKGCGNGIAMGNARPSVKNIANEIIGDNNNDSIENYLIKKEFIDEQ